MYWLRQYWNIIFSFCEQAQKWNILFQCSLRFFKITLAIFPLRIIDSLLLFLGAPYCYEAFCSLNILKEFSGLHYCLFVKVLVFHFVSKALYLLCFCCLCVSHATCLYYHVSCFVSTTFLTFLFFSFACLLCLLIAAKTIISFTFTFINRKFQKKTG